VNPHVKRTSKRHVIGLILLLAVSLLLPAQGKAAPLDKLRLPNIDELYFLIIKDNDAQLLALQGGQIDLLGDIARFSDIKSLSDDERVNLYLAEGYHAFYLGLNLRKSPWDRTELRQSLWEIVNRKQIVRDVFGGYALPLFSFLPPASPYTLSASAADFDIKAAKERLKQKGWRWSKKGVLICPGEADPLPKMKLLTPTAQVAPTTAEIAERICESMRSLGIPIETEPMDFSMMVARLDRRDFDAYVMAWELSRDPDSLYAFYHSSMDVPGGYNISGIRKPDLDEALESLKYASNEAEARVAAEKVQRLLYKYIPQVPIYSRYHIAALRREWKGAIASLYMTPDNTYSLLSLKHDSKRTFYWCLSEEPRNLNPLSAASAYEWQVLSIIYESLLAVDPFTLKDIPWLAKSWRLDTVTKGGKEKTRITFHIREDVKWQDGSPFSASDVKATIEFLKKFAIPRYFDLVKDVERVEATGNTITVTFSGKSYWYLHQIGGLPILPARVLSSLKDWRNLPEGHIIGTGPFSFSAYKPGEYVKLDKNELYWRKNIP